MMNYEMPLNVAENNVGLSVNAVPNVELQVAESLTSGGTTNYNALNNKPQINSVQLIGNKSFDDLGMSALTNMDILNILK